MQYVDKAEVDFSLRLNNHRKDVYKADAISASRDIAMKDDIFNWDASVILIEKICKNTLSRETKKNY